MGKTIPQEKGLLIMTLNYIWLWGSILEALGSSVYPIIVITPSPTMDQSGSTTQGLT